MLIPDVPAVTGEGPPANAGHEGERRPGDQAGQPVGPGRRVTHVVIEQIGQGTRLAGDLVLYGLAIVVVGESPGLLGLRFGDGTQLPAQFLLAVDKFTCLISHVAHFFGKLARRLASQRIAHLLQLTLGSGTGTQGRGDLLLFQGFGGLLDLGAGLLKTLAGLSQTGLVLRSIHALGQSVHIVQKLLFFLAETFQFASQSFALGLVLAGEKCGLEPPVILIAF